MIYCVEDDGAVRGMVLYTLNASGFEARGFGDGEAFFAAVQERVPRLILLDVMLPGEDGLQILKRLRSQADTASVPVIMATARGTEFDKVLGLDAGADDYLSKPFGMMEMVSRIRAVLRRTEGARKRCLNAGRLCLDTQAHTVCLDGAELALTLKEFELLRLFMENPGRAYTREELLAQVWDTDYVGESRTVDVHVGTLRTKLGVCGEYVQTVRGVGYRFEA